MGIKDRQAEAYLEESKLSIEAAKAAFAQAERTGKDLWHSVVKSSYDAMEQAISAMLAWKGVGIPRSHPGKIERLVNEFGESEVTERIYSWLGRRAKTQYVDVKGREIVIPHKVFDREDATDALEDAGFVVERAVDFLEK